MLTNLISLSADGLLALNTQTAPHGLSLTPAQARMIAAGERQTLLSTGRVAFGESAAQRLIPAFCASPYIERQAWAGTLCELTELFYAVKGETHDQIDDGALIAAMARVYDGRAHGALAVLADMTADEWLREAAHDHDEEDDDEPV